MAIGKKIRIYDLARDLKQDAKRVMEDLRREGADVSVPSNSVSIELAEKIRLKYFPKTEVAPKRAIKVIKATRKDDAAATAEVGTPEIPEVEVPEIVEPAGETFVEVAEDAGPELAATATKPRNYKLQKKAVKPVETIVETEPEFVENDEPEMDIDGEADVLTEVEVPSIEPETRPAARILRPTGTQIKQLTLTRD
ncbi:MAG: hypothetical protein HOP17_07065, partial [Acidobacteria bacterium]|nr:hypothetical protein [Acidobacteriota bacterium]